MSYPELERAISVVKALRHPQTGCPWDLEQTHQTLLKYLIEESYEFIEAVQENDPAHMEEELGDLLLQILLHAEIGNEKNLFNIETLSKKIADKLIERHPHVFGELQDQQISPAQVMQNWEKIKASKTTKKKYFINHKLTYAPALSTAFTIGQKSKEVNFDWEDANQVLYKVEEEWQELKEELYRGQVIKERVKEEMGDLLFSIAQLARHLGCDPEETLRESNLKFIKRFNKIEDIVDQKGKKLTEMPQSELEELWVQVKRK
ncbi:MAG: nucleoside triphosphate pyrophosphohydrolase [Bacteriovoracaceae bacterium]